MRRPTVFCVQVYERAHNGLVAGRREQFTCATDADLEGERLSASVAGVLVFGVDGDPDSEIWGEEAVFARHGWVPRIEY